MINANDEQVIELAKLIYAQNIIVNNNFNHHEAKRLAKRAEAGARLFYEAIDDSDDTK